ncbi:MAG TPA: hypothetical protein DIT89_12810 [Planctomycetaceae bacterium]|nr:hypothetical protein [Planctomycetaceae bacterium]
MLPGLPAATAETPQQPPLQDDNRHDIVRRFDGSDFKLFDCPALPARLNARINCRGQHVRSSQDRQRLPMPQPRKAPPARRFFHGNSL